MVKKTSDIVENKMPSWKPDVATILYYLLVILIVCAVLNLLGWPL